MAIFGRKLTILSGISAMIIAGAACVCGIDNYFGDRGTEYRSFLTGAAQVKGGDDLSKLEGKLVYAVGKPSPSQAMADPDLGLKFDVLSLRREDEIYQWFEQSRKHRRYVPGWADAPIRSADFRIPEGHANRGRVEFASYGDRSADVLVGGVAVDPSYMASVREKALWVTDDMLAALPESVRSRYVLDQGRLVEGTPVPPGSRDTAKIGTNRITFTGTAPMPGVVVGIFGHIGEFIPGAVDLKSTINSVENAEADAHWWRLSSSIALLVLAGAAFGRDFATAPVERKPIKFGR
jgi:hypothetical protein